jgi:hypothetical protein
MGIDVDHVYAMSFGIGLACLGAAACFLLPAYYVNPQVGNGFVLVAFTIVVLGGMGSFAGALVGGLSDRRGRVAGRPVPGESLGQIGIFADLHRRAAVPAAGHVRGQGMKARPAADRRHRALRRGRLRAAGHQVGRHAELRDDGAVRHAHGAGLEHAGRLRRAVLVRACAVLRHRRLRAGHRAAAGRHQPWVALPLAVAGAAAVGLFVGALTFRYGLKGSYFALVTLAFAEVFRILALSVPFTGAGVGLMVPLRESVGNMQFADARGLPLGGAGDGGRSRCW